MHFLTNDWIISDHFYGECKMTLVLTHVGFLSYFTTIKNWTDLHSLPRVLLSSALWRLGYWWPSLLLAAWAHTMKAFMGLLTWILFLSSLLALEFITSNIRFRLKDLHFIMFSQHQFIYLLKIFFQIQRSSVFWGKIFQEQLGNFEFEDSFL